ncbi:MAG: trypsin-like peptidase domain-containing protein [Oscillospiraceae bacterium]|nr:trypsin-like peptidase domain-containing protein [Oscillospiraceae bacterium]
MDEEQMELHMDGSDVLPREVVLTYAAPPPQEVVERYLSPPPQQEPESQQPPAASGSAARTFAYTPGLGSPERGGMRSLWPFFACIGVLLLAVVLFAALYIRAAMENQSADRRDFSYEFSVPDKANADDAGETTIDRYPNGDGTRLRYEGTHGSVLSIQDVYARVNPCTVTIATELPSGGAIIGTGVIFTSDGYILTNAHVITGGQRCFVVLDNGRSFTDVKLVGLDEEKDLAVLKVNAQMLPTAEFGDSDALSVGDTVYAIGNPLGVELRGTLTDGIVSAINRDVSVDGVRMTLIQTNAALNNGNSGGPLINVYGQVVGINTMKMGSTSTVSVEGLGFAIPVSSAAWMVNDLIAFGEIRGEPILGITVLTTPVTLLTGETALRIAEVVPDGPAEKAGLLVGDCIVRADGAPLTGLGDLLRARRRYCVGETLSLEVDRKGKRLTIAVTLEESDA